MVSTSSISAGATERSGGISEKSRRSTKRWRQPADQRPQADWIDVTGFTPVTAPFRPLACARVGPLQSLRFAAGATERRMTLRAPLPAQRREASGSDHLGDGPLPGAGWGEGAVTGVNPVTSVVSGFACTLAGFRALFDAALLRSGAQ